MAPLRQRYPLLASANVSSFAEVISVSAKFLKTNAVKTAGDHAATYYRSNPRMNLASIHADSRRAEAMDFLSFLTEKSEALRNVTIQPTGPLEPDLDPEIISMPPRPPAHTLPQFHQLHEGASLIIPPGFQPDGCPMPAPKSAEYALAVEYIHQKDYLDGLSIVLPHDVACRLFRRAGLPLNATPTDIVAATDKPEGRLVVDVTRSRLNHIDKRQQLTDLYGPIIYPQHADWCRLFASVRELFPGEQLYMFKADFKQWFKRTRLNPRQVGLLAMPFHIDGAPYVVIPLVGQFGCQEFNYISTQVSAFIYARVRNRDMRIYRGPVRHCFSDDTAGFLPRRLYAGDDQWFTYNAVLIAGEDAAPPTKKSISLTQTTVGALYDLTDMDATTIGISESTFLKLICVFFLELPQIIIPNITHIKIKQYQRVGSYMCLSSGYIPLLKPYTHGVYHNIAGLHPNTRTAAISDRTAIDIAFWRATLFATCTTPQWLSVPINIPPLVNRNKDQRIEDFSLFQAANSHIIVGTDAATGSLHSPTWGGGWTANHIHKATSSWGMYEPPTFADFLQSCPEQPTADQLSLLDQINLYEAIIVVVACDAILQSLPADRPDHITLFVWCDNTSAIAWLTRNKNNHPTVNFLLQVWARLQAKYKATINCGHIQGLKNVVPDAISRQFKVPDGLRIQASLSHLMPHLSLPPWYMSMLHCFSTPSATAWQTAAHLPHWTSSFKRIRAAERHHPRNGYQPLPRSSLRHVPDICDVPARYPWNQVCDNRSILISLPYRSVRTRLARCPTHPFRCSVKNAPGLVSSRHSE